MDEERHEDFDDLKGTETAQRRKFVCAALLFAAPLAAVGMADKRAHFTIGPAFGLGQGRGELRVSGGRAADRGVGAAELGGRHAAGAAEADERQHLRAGGRVEGFVRKGFAGGFGHGGPI